MTEMSRADRGALIRVIRLRRQRAKEEAETREKVLLSEIEDQITAEYSARDQMWSEAMSIARDCVAKVNDQIRAACLDIGVPVNQAPEVELGWRSRTPDFESPSRRAELRKRATTKLAALTKTAKTAIGNAAGVAEERLILGGLESDEAMSVVKEIPTVEQLMPALGLDDLGVKGWQPPDDLAGRLLTPSTPADRKRRQILRAIENNPGASNRRITEIANCDHKTVAAYRQGGVVGELPESDGEFPNEGGTSS